MAGMQPLSQGSLLRWVGENPGNEVGPVWSTTIALKQILSAKEVYQATQGAQVGASRIGHVWILLLGC